MGIFVRISNARSPKILTANTFSQPDVVKASPKKAISVKGNSFVHQLAPHSLEALVLRKA